MKTLNQFSLKCYKSIWKYTKYMEVFEFELKKNVENVSYKESMEA